MLGPAIGISASYQIGALADQIVGSLLPTGGLSAISYADRLYQLPGGVIVIATGSVLLREMSARIALGDDRGALVAQNRAASLTLALGAPFVVAFLLIPDLIVAVAFEHGAFKADALYTNTRVALGERASTDQALRVGGDYNIMPDVTIGGAGFSGTVTVRGSRDTVNEQNVIMDPTAAIVTRARVQKSRR